MPPLAFELLAASCNHLACWTACRSCGICKDVLRELESVCQESRQQRARIVFLQHDMQVGGMGGWVGGWVGWAGGWGSWGHHGATCSVSSSYARCMPACGGKHNHRRSTCMAAGAVLLPPYPCLQTTASLPSPLHWLPLQDAFDWPSDISRMYSLRTAPRFLFFVDVRPLAAARLPARLPPFMLLHAPLFPILG